MKKTIKILALLLTVAMLIPMLTSCFEMTQDDPAPEKELFGSVNDNVYVNEYFDLSLTIPEHWVFEDKDNLSDNPYFFFSDLTAEEKAALEFTFECRAVNTVTADAIEISIERLNSKYVFNGHWNFSNWSTGSGRFSGRPEYFASSGEIIGEIAGEQYDGRNYVIMNQGTAVGRSAIFFKRVNEYIIDISILSDGFFGEDASFNKNNAIGRMTDWFGKPEDIARHKYTAFARLKACQWIMERGDEAPVHDEDFILYLGAYLNWQRVGHEDDCTYWSLTDERGEESVLSAKISIRNAVEEGNELAIRGKEFIDAVQEKME